jgi:hypothetical protein
LLYNVLATGGLIVVLIVVIWGLFHLATLLSPWLSSVFKSSPVPAALHVSAPASAVSGTPISVSWTYSTSAKGSYAFLYACNDSLRFDTAGAQGKTNTIPCGAAFTVTGTSLTVTPSLSGTKALQEPLTVIFVPQSGPQVQGSATITINPRAQQTPAPVVQSPAVVAHTGPADLSVQILSATVDPNGLATIVFDISNNGAGDSGGYTFQAYLPTRTTYTYYSPAQVSLSPGSHIVSTLRFTQAAPGAISIIVDPSNNVSDSNRTNNYAAQNLSMPYGYNPQTYYNQNQVTPIYYGQQPYVY